MLVPKDPSSIFRGPLPENTARTSILIAMLTIAIYMAALVDLKALIIFKRRNTLYFWSLLITSWGIIGHSLGVILKWFVSKCPWEVHTSFSSFGWWAMVTGQSLVLYSRLHLVVRDERILRAVLIMIIVNFCLFQVPTTVQKFGSTQTDAGLWLTVYHVYERIQLVVFTLQELIISIIYIRAALTWFPTDDPGNMRYTKQFLIYLNVLCIALDIAIVCEVFSDEWVYEEATQSLAYAIKLTLEFAVLNKVMEAHRLGPGGCTTCHRRFASRSVHSLTERGLGHSSCHNHPTARQGSLRQSCLGASWPGSKPEESKGLGSFDEEDMVEEPLPIELVAAYPAELEPACVRLKGEEVGKSNVVTTDVATRFGAETATTIIDPGNDEWEITCSASCCGQILGRNVINARDIDPDCKKISGFSK